MSNYRNLLENWNKFLKEEEALDEVTEEEIANLDDILHNLDPKDLSFNNIFGDKMRIVQPMKVKDEKFDMLKNLLVRSGYDPDFKTGLATYYVLTLPAKDGARPTVMMLTRAQADDPKLTSKKEVRKKQIKIGKLLQKGSRLYDNAHKAWSAADEINPEDFGVKPDKYDPDDTANVDKYRAAAEEASKKAQRDLDKISDVFPDRVTSASSTMNIYKELAEWWNKKSAFYRENPDDAQTADSPYSIVYTRHPIDVMRMSDFDNIESCHSPPSRRGDNSYYKCAVAEAHGHGPVAYVVRNEDLNELISKYDLEDASYQDLLDALEENDEEFFQDNARGVGDITPLSRVRLKKFVNPQIEMSLAVPSTRIYGKRLPSLYQNISDFTKQKQSKEIKTIEAAVKKIGDEDNKVFNTEGFFDLGNWERHGGSYEDAGDYPADVMHQYLGYSMTGRTHYDNTTEDNLEVGNPQEQWQNQVDEIRDRSNRRYQAARITRADVEDDGAGEYYIDIHAELRIVIPEGDFVSSAFQDSVRKAIEYLPAELKEMGFDELEDYVNYNTLNPRSQDWADLIRQADEEGKNQIVIEIPISIENVNPEGGGYAYSPDNFEDIAQAIDSFDDKADDITAIAKNYFKRAGVMEGGELITFARAIDEESWYEWDYEVDDDYSPTSIEVETKTYVNFEDLAQKLPITLERANSDQSGEVYIMFAGDPLALASQASDGDGNFKWWEVRSPEFENDSLGGFKDLDEVKDYVRDQLTKMILRPWSQSRGGYGKTPKGIQSSRDYLVAVSVLMRDAAGGKEGEFMFPNREMWVNGPDSDDEYKMMFRMLLDDDDSDEVVKSAHQIMADTDDENQLKEIFRTAFAKVGKISGTKATVTEVRKYFNKFDLF